ncbi:MAG: hypothetical protein IRY99_03460 [Isosphaeraceae bacterium]|nr:hypothetical protein [Isosphaeraceae bacterium]
MSRLFVRSGLLPSLVLAVALALVFAPRTVGAGEPKAVLHADSTAAEGATLWLDAEGSASDEPLRWRQKSGPPTKLIVLTVEGATLRGTMAMVPKVPAGTYRFEVIAVGTPPGADRPTADADLVEVTVAPPTPPPDPVPPPAPPPAPVYGLDAVIRQNIGLVNLSGAARAAGAKRLAQSMRDMARQKGQYRDAQAYVTAVGQADRQALGADYAAWKPLLDKLNAQLAALNRAGKLVTVDQHAVAWAEIARALEALP